VKNIPDTMNELPMANSKTTARCLPLAVVSGTFGTIETACQQYLNCGEAVLLAATAHKA